MKTNLDRMHMDPGIWWMLVSHMRKESSIATPTHPIYYDERKSTYNTYFTQTTISNTLQTRTETSSDREVCTRCYAREHILLEQTMFGHDFGVGPRLEFPVVRGDASTATAPGFNSMRVNIISHIPPASDFGKTLTKWTRVGVEGASYIFSFEQKSLCLKVKYASPLVETSRNKEWLPRPILGKRCRPLMGQYFSHSNTSMRVISYDDGAFVYASPSNNISVVHVIDIETMMSYMAPPSN
jgi:hypothetical protein